ncbi:MAG: hypothetical protein JNK63_10060 [Chthonomonas sp.]|nr:hypothetical protein [Chthonomonas sp.]
MFAPEEKLTPRDRREAERSVSSLQGGDPTELGNAYLRLAHIYKFIGTGTEQHPFPASAGLAEMAVGLLRDSGDRLAYARALRASVVAFTTDKMPEARSRLLEALSIAEEAGDAKEIGWSHQALWSHALRTSDKEEEKKHRRLQHEAWINSGDDEATADALFTDALHGERDWKQYERAAQLYELAKGWRSAATSYGMAAMNAAHNKEPNETIRRLARKQIICAQRWGDKIQIRAGKRRLRLHR